MSQKTYSPSIVFYQTFVCPLIRLALLPYYIVVLTLAVFRAPNEIRWVTKSVLEQIKVPIDSTVDTRAEAIRSYAADLLADQNFAELADWLVADERKIDEAQGGARAYQLIIDAALYDRTLAMIEAGELDPPNSLDKVVMPFEEALEEYPDHHGRAVLTAMRHLQLGWIFRGSGFVYEITDIQWEKVGQHYARAAEILNRFDADKLQSPSLAMAKHKLLAIEGASGKLDAAFEVWRKLDPMSPTVFFRHAFHCLPRWGGSYQKILVDARRLAGESSDKWGMAAYALYLIQLSECEPEIFEHMDVELFEEGVHDLLERRSDPAVVNFWLREMNFLASATKLRGDDTPDEARLRDLARRLRSHIIRNCLVEIDSSVWEDGTSLPLALVANEFEEQVKAGMNIVLREDGKLVATGTELVPA